MTNMENGPLECQFFFPSRLCSKYKGLPPTIRVLTIKIHITLSQSNGGLCDLECLTVVEIPLSM